MAELHARKKFAFADDTRPQMSVEERNANSLEFIAHYLDRIDGHLERLVKSVESGGSNETLRIQLMNLERAIVNSARR